VAYTPFDKTVPDASSQSIAEVTTTTRENFAAMRDALVTFGSMPGWSAEAQDSDGTNPPTTPDKPYQWVYSRGTERVKVVPTYGTTGGATDCVEEAVFYYSSDSGVNYSLMSDTDYPNAKLTITYNSDSIVTSYSWS